MTDSQAIRVMLVDDHTMVRRGLATFLKVYPDLEMVGEAANGREAVDSCERCRPDVILMDLMMPEMDGASATRTAHAGRSTLAPEATQILIRSANEGPAPGHDLTPPMLTPFHSTLGNHQYVFDTHRDKWPVADGIGLYDRAAVRRPVHK
jgi:CheY-like chemotaxis protein